MHSVSEHAGCFNPDGRPLNAGQVQVGQLHAGAEASGIEGKLSSS